MSDSRNSKDEPQDPFSMESHEEEDTGSEFKEVSVKKASSLDPALKKKLFLGIIGLVGFSVLAFTGNTLYSAYAKKTHAENKANSNGKSLAKQEKPAPLKLPEKSLQSPKLEVNLAQETAENTPAPKLIKEPVIQNTSKNNTPNNLSNNLETAFADADRNKENKQNIEDLKKKLSQEAQANIKASTSDLEAKLANTKQQAELLNISNQEVRTQIQQLLNAMEAMNQQAAQSREQIARLESNLALVSNNLSKVSTEIVSVDSRVSSLSNTLNSVTQDLNKSRREARSDNFDSLALPPLNSPINKNSKNQTAHNNFSNNQNLSEYQQPEYSIHAVVPGRVWLKSTEGQILSLTEGEALGDYGKVVMIDANNHIILTSSGVSFR
ncbi:MAG: hypothetical protein ACKOAD_05345 [Gammaproteobacteria bacterium]